MTKEESRARERIARSKEKRKRQLRRNIIIGSAIIVVFLVAIALLIFLPGKRQVETSVEGTLEPVIQKYIAQKPEIEVDLLTVNPYSRPGDALEKVTGIVVHYTGNPGTTARQNRSYFQNLAKTHETSASSHFVIGLEGEIIQCVPCDEIAYASKKRNVDTISIECCIEDESGIFNAKTYQSLIELTTWLMGEYDLEVDDVLRHYDVTGKKCPKYYVENESSWRAFKEDLLDYIDKKGQIKE